MLHRSTPASSKGSIWWCGVCAVVDTRAYPMIMRLQYRIGALSDVENRRGLSTREAGHPIAADLLLVIGRFPTRWKIVPPDTKPLSTPGKIILSATVPNDSPHAPE